MKVQLSQCASAVLMVRPKAFGFNAETATTNRFQAAAPAAHPGVEEQARAEFDGFAAALASEGVTVCLAEDTVEPRKPDAVFPNNWVSFHADGTVVLYPMHAANRRIERRQEIVDIAVRDSGFVVKRTVDLTHHEKAGRYLEGTGSMVLDHHQRVAYACHSPRTNEVVAEEWARELGYQLEIFKATDETGTPIYHTNVIMSIGTRYALVALDTVGAADRARVAERLRASQRDLVTIDRDEVRAFAGNMLEVGSWDEHLGDFHILVMSRTARKGVKPENFAKLSASVDAVLAPPIDVIERLGGGSVRCMLAEVFLR
jgi:hypothetical protein